MTLKVIESKSSITISKKIAVLEKALYDLKQLESLHAKLQANLDKVENSKLSMLSYQTHAISLKLLKEIKQLKFNLQKDKTPNLRMIRRNNDEES